MIELQTNFKVNVPVMFGGYEYNKSTRKLNVDEFQIYAIVGSAPREKDFVV